MIEAIQNFQPLSSARFTVKKGIRIWIWLNQPEDRSSAATYRHVSLEIHEEGREDELLYISFWKETHRKVSGCEERKLHFHSQRSLDDQVCSNCTVIYYDLPLNVYKIQKAFHYFKNNPERWNSLGWSCFHKPYTFDAVGLTFYLLDQGGIFKWVARKRSAFGELCRVTSFWGIPASLLSYWYACKLNNLSINDNIQINSIIRSNLVRVKTSLEEIKLISYRLETLAPSHFLGADKIVLPNYITSTFLNLTERMTSLLEILKNGTFKISGEILRIAKVSACISVAAFGLYWFANHYFVSDYSFVDIERWAQKAKQRQEQREHRK